MPKIRTLPTTMKCSLTLLAVLLPIIAKAQSNNGDVNVRSAFVILPIFIDVPQVVVSPGGALTYNPSNFTASNGTNVNFMFAQYEFVPSCYNDAHTFLSRNIAHSVTQSTIESPCTYLAGGNGTASGFDSGIQSALQWTITITNDQERK